MGKKSKKGVSRAGAKARPGKGRGKKVGRSRSGSQASGSVASKEDLCALSQDSGPIMKAVKTNVNSTPPANVSVPTPKKTTPAVVVPTATPTNEDENKPVLHEESIAVSTKETLEKEQPEPVLSQPDSPLEDVWSNKLRDVVADTPAVLDVTMDEADGSAMPVKEESRGLVDLTEPAAKEAQSTQKDCGCTIL